MYTSREVVMEGGTVTKTSNRQRLRRELRQAGITRSAIDAVWPDWWSNEAEDSPSAVAELRYTIARRLGMSPASLMDGHPRFLWRDEARFKSLAAQGSGEHAALASYGFAVARHALAAAPSGAALEVEDAQALRGLLQESLGEVTVLSLLSLCWSTGIPVVALRLFPLRYKRMQAMTVRLEGRCAILVGQDVHYLAPLAHVLAHELGHVVLGHLPEGAAIVDIESSLVKGSDDSEEVSADLFALETMTGNPHPEIEVSDRDFSARQLAVAAIEASASSGIDPGTLALSAGHETGRWRQAYGALKLISPGRQPVTDNVNQIARQQFNWGEISPEGREFLETVMGESGRASHAG